MPRTIGLPWVLKFIIILTVFGWTTIPFWDPRLKWLVVAFVLAAWVDARRAARRPE